MRAGPLYQMATSRCPLAAAAGADDDRTAGRANEPQRQQCLTRHCSFPRYRRGLHINAALLRAFQTYRDKTHEPR